MDGCLLPHVVPTDAPGALKFSDAAFAPALAELGAAATGSTRGRGARSLHRESPVSLIRLAVKLVPSAALALRAISSRRRMHGRLPEP